MKTAPLSLVCTVNPRLDKARRPSDGTEVTFVPMASVDETFGQIKAPQVRAYSEVAKGFTPFRENDVLLAKITPCMENGKAAIARNLRNGIGFGSTEFHVLRAGPEILPEWIFYYIRQPDFRRRAKATFRGAVGQQRVPADFLEREVVPVPHLDEQRRIADILTRAEGIIRLQRQAADKAREAIPALFLDMFGDPATNSRKWDITHLGDLIGKGPQNGLYKPATEYGEGYPILRIDGFYDGRVTDLGSLRRVRLTDEEAARYALKEGNIVINRVNSPEYLGKSAIVPPLDEFTVFESNMMQFSVNQESIDPRFLIQLLQTPYIRQVTLSRAKHAINQSSINQTDVKSLPVILPPLHLQQAFAERVNDIHSILAQRDASQRSGDGLFQALLAQAFSY
ncbi:MAG: restriction endonuclease subunit S [Candidatus Binataceae bacterium]